MAHKRRRKAASRRKRRRVSGDPSINPSVVSGVRKRAGGKKKKAKRSKRRGHVGAMSKPLTGSLVGDILVGMGGGILVGIAVDKFSPMSGKINSGAKVGLGVVTAFMGKKTPMALGVGIGLAGQGTYTGLHEFGIMHGIDEFMHGMGLGKANDTLTIEMNGTERGNSGELMAGEQSIMGTKVPQPSVVSGDENMSGDGGGTMPSVVNGY